MRAETVGYGSDMVAEQPEELNIANILSKQQQLDLNPGNLRAEPVPATLCYEAFQRHFTMKVEREENTPFLPS